jgi:hypothetical protein
MTNYKSTIARFTLLVASVASISWAAVVGYRMSSSTGAGPADPSAPIDGAVYSLPHPWTVVNTLECIDVPANSGLNSPVAADLNVVDTNGDLRPDSNLLQLGSDYGPFMLTDVRISIHPESFRSVTSGGVTGGENAIGLVLKVREDDGGQITERDVLVWRAESFKSVSSISGSSVGDIVNADFEFDQCTLSVHYQTPLIFFPRGDGGIALSYEVEFVSVAAAPTVNQTRWVAQADGVYITFSGRLIGP